MSNFIDDVSVLNDLDLGPIDTPSNDEPYETVKTRSYATPPAGRYNLQLPTNIKVGAWKPKDGRKATLELQMDPVKIVNPGGPGDGVELRFVNVSTRRIAGNNASAATDLLQRAGITPLPQNVEEWQDAASQLSGATIEGVYCDWECRVKDEDPIAVRSYLKEQGIKNTTDNRAGKTVLRGMKNFPSDGKGGHLSKMTFENGPSGGALTLYANLRPTLRGFGMTAEEQAEAGA